jgi:hypothetical protein
MRCLVAVLVVLVGLLAPTSADAYMLCSLLRICPYMSPGFTMTVVDADSGKPVADVYAWAEWVQYANHGLNGPLMIQEAVSTADGRLVFSWWGPRLGSRAGLSIGSDPAVILFKPGYATLIVYNGERPGMHQTDAIRGGVFRGEAQRLQPFRGSAVEWVEQLSRLVYPALTSNVSDEQRDQFRAAYLRRLRMVETEVARLPQSSPEVIRLRSSLELSARFFQEGLR